MKGERLFISSFSNDDNLKKEQAIINYIEIQKEKNENEREKNQ